MGCLNSPLGHTYNSKVSRRARIPSVVGLGFECASPVRPGHCTISTIEIVYKLFCNVRCMMHVV